MLLWRCNQIVRIFQTQEMFFLYPHEHCGIFRKNCRGVRNNPTNEKNPKFWKKKKFFKIFKIFEKMQNSSTCAKLGLAVFPVTIQ